MVLPKEKKKIMFPVVSFKGRIKLIFTSGGVLSEPGDGTKLMFCLLKPPDVSVLGLYSSHPSLLASVKVQGAPCLDTHSRGLQA